jgi:hypothetical protein
VIAPLLRSTKSTFPVYPLAIEVPPLCTLFVLRRSVAPRIPKEC